MSASDSSKKSQTNWAHLADRADDEIDYSDIPPLDESFFENATLREPTGKETVTLRLDRDVLAWFRSRGEAFERRINAVLRAHTETHKSV